MDHCPPPLDADLPAVADSDCIRSFEGMRSVYPAMHKVFAQLENLALSDAPLLIQGESGTGKQRAATALHRASARRAHPLVPVVCTALSAAQLDAMLWTPTAGSSRDSASPLRRAQGGTLLLRDVAALDLSAQGVLLRALQSEPSLELNLQRAAKRVRLISTAGPDLARRVKRGLFRADLYYRLVAAQVQLLPLRERPADIPLLACEALHQAARAQGCPSPRLDPQAVELLTGYGWPGNLRELFNVLGQALLRLRVPAELRPADFAGLLYAVAAPAHVEIPIGTSLAEAERQLILQTLAAHGCIKQTTADTLGISRRTLYEKLALYRKQGTYALPFRGARELSASPEPRQGPGSSAKGAPASTTQAAPLPTGAAEGLEPGP